MATSNFSAGKSGNALHREQRALFAQAAAKHKIRVAEEVKLKPVVNAQPGATGEVVSVGGPAAGASTEKTVQEPVKGEIENFGVAQQETAGSEKAQVSVMDKAPMKTKAAKTKVSKKATSQTLSGGQSLDETVKHLKASDYSEWQNIFVEPDTAMQALASSAAAAIQRKDFVTPVLLTNYNQDSLEVSNSSSVIQPTPAQVGVQTFPPGFTNNPQDLIGLWNYSPVNDTVLVLNGPGATSDGPANNTQESLSGPVSPPINPLPAQVPTGSAPVSVGANYKDFFGMRGDESSDPATTTTANSSLSYTENLFDNNNSMDRLFGMDDSFTSYDSLLNDENFWNSTDGLFSNNQSFDSTENLFGEDNSLNSTDGACDNGNPSNSSTGVTDNDSNETTDSLSGDDKSSGSADSLFGDDDNFLNSTDSPCDNGNSSNSGTSLLDNYINETNGTVLEAFIPTDSSTFLDELDMLVRMGPIDSNAGNSSNPSPPEDFNIAPDDNGEGMLPSFTEEEGEPDIIDLISNEGSDDLDSVDETSIQSQPADQSFNQSQPTVEAAPNVYYPQHSHVQLESNQNQSGPVGSEADGVRRISSIAQEQSRMIGTNVDQFCFKCLHPGHMADTVTCPVGRVESLTDPRKETFYTRLDKVDIRQKLLTQDLRWISEGLNWGIDMAQEGVLNALGVLPSALLYLKELLTLWTTTSKGKEYAFGAVSELELVCGEGVEIDESQQNTPGLYKMTKSHNVMEVTFDSLVKGGSAPPPRRRRRDTSVKCVAELLGLDPIGARPKATCSFCFYPGHTFNSTVLCPFGRIENVVNKIKTQKTWKIVDLDDEVAKLKKVIDGLGEEDERTHKLVDILEQWEHFSRGAGAPKQKRAYTRSGNNSKTRGVPPAPNTTTNAKRQMNSPPSRARLHMDSSAQASSSANNGFGAHHNTGANNSSLMEVSSSPVDLGHGSSSPVSNHSSDTSVEDPLLHIPAYLGLTRRSGIKTIGARPDTLCKECFYTGHDKRSQACPANILRRALFMGSLKDLEDTGNSCQDIADILAWEASQSANMKANSALRQKLETLHSKFVTAWNRLSPPQVGTSSQENRPTNNRDQVFSTPQKRSYQDACFQEQENPPMHQFNQTPHSQEQLESPIHFKQAPLLGICVDHSKLDSQTLMQILPFVINGQQETRGLRVDHAKLSPQLVMALAPFMIADTPSPPPPIQDNTYQAGQHKESRKSFQQPPPHGNFNPYTNPPCTGSDFPRQSQFHSSPPAFQNPSGAMAQARGGNQHPAHNTADLGGGQYQPATKRRRNNY
ncbi:hypothetical protein HOY82DRAFT_542705 [Tuber indicum]|nr:hypothetical protein HOY82DRAFT_542705 [Tuber indicum]